MRKGFRRKNWKKLVRLIKEGNDGNIYNLPWQGCPRDGRLYLVYLILFQKQKQFSFNTDLPACFHGYQLPHPADNNYITKKIEAMPEPAFLITILRIQVQQ